MGDYIAAWAGSAVHKLILAALAVLLCVSAGAFIVYRHYTHVVAELTTERDTARADAQATRAAITAKAASQAKVDRTYTQRSKDLTNALQTSQDWAAAPVPDAVYDSLFPGTRAAPAAR